MKLIRVTKDPDLKEAYFTTPLALTASESPTKFQKTSHQKGKYEWNSKPKGKGKGKFHQNEGFGKGFKSSGNKGKHGDLNLVTQTPDGRDICFAFNSQGCNGKCGRVHVCRVRGRYADHAAREHSKHQSDLKDHPNTLDSSGCCTSSVVAKEELTSNIS